MELMGSLFHDLFHESHHGIGSGRHVCPHATALAAATLAVLLAGCTPPRAALARAEEMSACRRAVRSLHAFDTFIPDNASRH